MISIQRRKVHDCSLTISIVGQVQDGDDIAYNGYWVGKDCETGTVTLYSKQKWEPVPTETWRDVTEDVTITNDGCLLTVKPFYSDKVLASIDIDGYRFRRITLANRLSDPGECFVVERKDP